MALRRKEQLGTLGVRELDDFVLDRWAVPRPARVDGAAVHCRPADVLGDDRLPFSLEEGDPAKKLRRVSSLASTAARLRPEDGPRIVERFDLALLPFQAREVNRTPIDTRRSSRLESFDSKPCILELFGKVCGGRISGA